jgi:hypothetical protein
MNTTIQKIQRAKALWYRMLDRIGVNSHADRGEEINAIEGQIKKAQKTWLKRMRPFRNSLGVILLPDNAPLLTDKHLKNCRLLPDREAVLQQMKVGGIAAEVGVQEGEFSRRIIQICQPAELHLVDIHLQAYAIHEKFEPEIDAGVVRLHEGDSATIINKFADNYFDFIYIDADHSYKGAKRDIQAAKTKIKENGFLLFNDYTYWSPGECMPYGVIQAVNELCVDDDWEIIYFALAGYMYCDVALKRRKEASG